jgi:hypothetical protein
MSKHEAATTISPGFGRFGGRPYSLELSLSASQTTPATERECERLAEQFAHGFTDCASAIKRDSKIAGGSVAVTDAGCGARSEIEDRHSALRSHL